MSLETRLAAEEAKSSASKTGATMTDITTPVGNEKIYVYSPTLGVSAVMDYSLFSATTGGTDGNGTNINRTNSTEDVAPTSGEVNSPESGDTATIRLADGKVEYWNYETSWVKAFVTIPIAARDADGTGGVSLDDNNIILGGQIDELNNLTVKTGKTWTLKGVGQSLISFFTSGFAETITIGNGSGAADNKLSVTNTSANLGSTSGTVQTSAQGVDIFNANGSIALENDGRIRLNSPEIGTPVVDNSIVFDNTDGTIKQIPLKAAYEYTDIINVLRDNSVRASYKGLGLNGDADAAGIIFDRDIIYVNYTASSTFSNVLFIADGLGNQTEMNALTVLGKSGFELQYTLQQAKQLTAGSGIRTFVRDLNGYFKSEVISIPNTPAGYKAYAVINGLVGTPDAPDTTDSAYLSLNITNYSEAKNSFFGDQQTFRYDLDLSTLKDNLGFNESLLTGLNGALVIHGVKAYVNVTALGDVAGGYNRDLILQTSNAVGPTKQFFSIDLAVGNVGQNVYWDTEGFSFDTDNKTNPTPEGFGGFLTLSQTDPGTAGSGLAGTLSFEVLYSVMDISWV